MINLSGRKTQLQNYMEQSSASIFPWQERVNRTQQEQIDKRNVRAQSAQEKQENSNVHKSFVFQQFQDEKQLKQIIMENQLKQSKNFTNAYINFKNIYGRPVIKPDVDKIEKIVQDKNSQDIYYYGAYQSFGQNNQNFQFKNLNSNQNNQTQPKQKEYSLANVFDFRYKKPQQNVAKNKKYKQKTLEPKKYIKFDKVLEENIKKLERESRWIPNSSFQRFFGKPAFENYGYGNTNPTYGGPIYGDYLKSHNVNPQRGKNHPQKQQVFVSAQIASKKLKPQKDKPLLAFYKKIQNDKIKLDQNTDYLNEKEQVAENLNGIQNKNLKESLQQIDQKLHFQYKKKEKKQQKEEKKGVFEVAVKLQEQQLNSFQRQKQIKEQEQQKEEIAMKASQQLIYNNPRNYSHLNPKYLEQIPCAGMPTQKINQT